MAYQLPSHSQGSLIDHTLPEGDKVSDTAHTTFIAEFTINVPSDHPQPQYTSCHVSQ